MRIENHTPFLTKQGEYDIHGGRKVGIMNENRT